MTAPNEKRSSRPPADFDGAWKDALRALIRPALEFFLPAFASDVDWTEPVDFLDKELRTITSVPSKSTVLTDNLIRFQMASGLDEHLLVHVETQAKDEPEPFPFRMFRYYYRALDRENLNVVALAIRTGTARDPGQFVVERYGTELSYRYNTYHALDADAQELKLSENPMVLAVQQVHRVRGDDWKKKEALMQLLRLLTERGYSSRQKLRVFFFMEKVLHIVDDEIFAIYQKEVEELERTTEKARFLSSVERRGIRKGFQEGEEKGRQEGEEKGRREAMLENARKMLARGFGPAQVADILDLPLEQVEALVEAPKKND